MKKCESIHNAKDFDKLSYVEACQELAEFWFRKKRLVALILCMAFSMNCDAQTRQTGNSEDQMGHINQIFDQLEAQGVDTGQTLLYGYFFVDKSKSKLEGLAAELMAQSYIVVGIDKIEGAFTLHVEKIEKHSRKSLYERGASMRNLASKHSVETYDGWDVGNQDPSKPLVSIEGFQVFMKSKMDEDLFNLGLRLYDLDIDDKAIIVFSECLKRNVKPDISSFKLAGALLATGKEDEGIKHLENAVKMNPKYVDAYFNLGAIYYDRGLYSKSVENYRKVYLFRPNDDKAVYGFAAAEYALGEFDLSLEDCKKALTLNPKNENAKVLFDMLQHRSK